MADSKPGSLNLLVSAAGHSREPVTVRYLASATVSDLSTGVARYLALSDGPWELAIGSRDGLVSATALVIDAQINDGADLFLLSPEDGRAASGTHPTLSHTDSFRLIHESGSQLGLAWGVSLGNPLALALSDDGAQITASVHNNHADLVVTWASDDSVLLRVAESVIASTNGHYFTGELEVGVGASLCIYRESDEHTMNLVVLTAAAHSVLAKVGEVPYRRIADTETNVRPDPFHRKIPRRNFGEVPKMDWPETIAQEGITLLFPLAFVFGGNFSWFSLVFPLYGIVRGVLKWRRVRNEAHKHAANEADWKRKFAKEIGLLKAWARRDRDFYIQRFRPIDEIESRILDRAPQMWQVTPKDEDFLWVPVGYGELKTSSTIELDEEWTTEGDLAAWRARIDEARRIENTPLPLSLSELGLAVVGGPNAVSGVANSLLVRIAYDHSPSLLTMAILASEHESVSAPLSWLAWLPHTKTPSVLFPGERVVLGREQVAAALLGSIEAAKADLQKREHLLLVVQESSGVPLSLLANLLEAAPGRVHVLWIGSSVGRIPSLFDPLILELEEASEGLATGAAGSEQTVLGQLLPDHSPRRVPTVDSARCLDIALALAPLVDETADASTSRIPQRVALGSTVGIEPDGQGQSIVDSWRTHSTVEELVCVLGERASGSFHLDLKKEGPHMLIGGTTGSGKSELLKSMLLSLCCRYSPTDLRLLLIDFKGGAALSDFADLPHSAGTVSNLEAADVRRLVAFLRREVQRRQELLRDYDGEFSNYRESHLLPRVLVVIDEFAGFATEGEGYLDSIMKVAAQGRSLGIHLVMATQRPQGTITPQISANVNARIALRTLDENDSISVIDTKQASLISRTQPGRAFARLDSGSVVEFQAPLTRSKQLDGIREQERATVAPHTPFRAVDRDQYSTNEKLKSDQAVVLRELQFATETLAKAQGRSPEALALSLEAQQPSLPKSLVAEDRAETPRFDFGSNGSFVSGGRRDLPVWIGNRDEPSDQRQVHWAYDLGRGAVLIQGRPGSGRTKLLTLIGRQVAATSAIIVVDCGDGTLSKALESISTSFHIKDRNVAEIAFAIDQAVSIAQRDLASETPLVVLIDRLELALDFEALATDPKAILQLISDGSRHGVHLVASIDSQIRIDSAVRRVFREEWTLDDLNPGFLRDSSGTLAMVYRPPKLTQKVRKLKSYGVGRPNIREFSGREILADDQVFSRVPLAIDETTHEPVFVSASRNFAIVGPDESGKTSALLTLGRRLSEFHKRPVPLFANYEIPIEWEDWVVDGWARLAGFDQTSPSERQWLPPEWPSSNLAPCVLIDEAQAIEKHETRASMLIGSHRDGVRRSLATFVREGLTSYVAAAHSLLDAGPSVGFEEHSWTRYRYAFLMPPPELSNSGPFEIMGYKRIVKPRAGRQYAPGEGVFVRGRTRVDVSMLYDEDILEFTRTLGVRGDE